MSQYMHPVEGVLYIDECVIGHGVDEQKVRALYDLVCNCPSTTDEDDPSCTETGKVTCACVTVNGPNYDNQELLLDERLMCAIGIFECGDRCQCAMRCGNSVSSKGTSSHLMIEHYGEKGFGVRTTGHIPKGAFICEYTGEVIGPEEAVLRENRGRGKYIVQMNEHTASGKIQTIVDAMHMSNIARYINHSCSPNCVVVPVRNGRALPKIGIYALRNLYVGEEITYNYYPESTELSETRCLCDAFNCKQFLPTTTICRQPTAES